MQFTDSREGLLRFQSRGECPCRVKIAGEGSLFSLSKWGGEAFLSVASGDEPRARIDGSGKRVVVEREGRVSEKHVFTALDEDRFEYDVVLLQEPESNWIALDLDFPEGLVFYRQPLFKEGDGRKRRTPPEVQGSYAVYWKEMHNQYRTGKFCHIYRPLIYDERGRKVWGDILIEGKRLYIDIPEGWLADASYPVVVDPVIGSQSAGSQTEIDWYDEDNFEDFRLQFRMFACKHLLGSTSMQGLCRASLYIRNSPSAVNVRPVLYEDAGGMPGARMSEQEASYVGTGAYPRWVQSSLVCFPGVMRLTPFWFGFDLKCEPALSFDYAGSMCLMYTEEMTELPSWFSDPEQNRSWPVRVSSFLEYGLPQSYARSVKDGGRAAGANPVRRVAVRKRVSAGAAAGEALGLTGVFTRLCASISRSGDVVLVGFVFARKCASLIGAAARAGAALALRRIAASAVSFLEAVAGRLRLRKEEVVFVSRIAREIEFKGDLL